MFTQFKTTQKMRRLREFAPCIFSTLLDPVLSQAFVIYSNIIECFKYFQIMGLSCLMKYGTALGLLLSSLQRTLNSFDIPKLSRNNMSLGVIISIKLQTVPNQLYNLVCLVSSHSGANVTFSGHTNSHVLASSVDLLVNINCQ